VSDTGDLTLGLATVLRSLIGQSVPQTRMAQHLLHLDAHETYEFASHHPRALRVEEAQHD
jgi:hypothetical protein